jgi:hypothetical protein
MIRLTRLVGCAAIVAACLAHCPEGNKLLAQEAAAASRARTSVLIVLVDELPHGSEAFEILRRAEIVPHDVILLRSDAGAAELTAAVRTLMAARQQGGDDPERSVVLRKRRSAASPPGRSLPWAPRVLNDLRQARAIDVRGVGMRPAVEIWLPSRRRSQHFR